MIHHDRPVLETYLVHHMENDCFREFMGCHLSGARALPSRCSLGLFALVASTTGSCCCFLGVKLPLGVRSPLGVAGLALASTFTGKCVTAAAATTAPPASSRRGVWIRGAGETSGAAAAAAAGPPLGVRGGGTGSGCRSLHVSKREERGVVVAFAVAARLSAAPAVSPGGVGRGRGGGDIDVVASPAD